MIGSVLIGSLAAAGAGGAMGQEPGSAVREQPASGPSGPRPGHAPPSAAPDAAARAGSLGATESQEREPRPEPSTERRSSDSDGGARGVPRGAPILDPTRPPDALPIEAPTIDGSEPARAQRLTAILISKTSRRAVIDGVSVTVGDRVGRARVAAIEPVRVRLVGDEGEIVLTLPGVPVKTEVAR